MTEPLVNACVQAGDEVTVAALPHIAPVYKAMQGVKQVLDWSFKRKRIELIKRIRIAQTLKNRFDRCIICPNSFKSALIPWMANVPERIGYLGEHRTWILTKALANPDRHHRGSMVNFYKKLLTLRSGGGDDLGLNPRDVPHLLISEELIQGALSEFSLTRGGFTVIAPGAEYGSAKRWPFEYYAELASKISLEGGAVIILGSASDYEGAARIKNAAQSKTQRRAGNIKNLAGRTTLSQAMALIAATKCLISNDSGLMHIGAALCTPQVAIFGSSSPLHTPPLNVRAEVLWLSLACAPCFKRECPLGHLQCLKDISVEQVSSAIQSSLRL